MIGTHSEDRFTNTPEDAAEFERMRGGSYGPPEDQPTAGEAAADAAMDAEARRMRLRREAAARDRGEYVPSARMDLAASAMSMMLAQSFGPGVDVRSAREGVLVLTSRQPMSRASLLVTIEGHYGDRVDVVDRADAVWVRLHRDMFGDPFEGASEPGSPF